MEREQIISKFGYRYWNKYLFDYEIKDYPEDGLYVIGKIGEKIYEFTEGKDKGRGIYRILPIQLYPFKVIPKINGCKVTTLSVKKYAEGELVICKIRYDEERYRYKATIMEKRYEYSELQARANIVIPEITKDLESEIVGLNRQAEEIYNRKNGLENEIEKERRKIENELAQQKDKIKDELSEFPWLEENYNLLMERLKEGKELSMIEISKEKKELADSLRLVKKTKESVKKENAMIERIKEKIRKSEDFISEYVNENKDLRKRFKANQGKYTELKEEYEKLEERNSNLEIGIRNITELIGRSEYEELIARTSDLYQVKEKQRLKKLLQEQNKEIAEYQNNEEQRLKDLLEKQKKEIEDSEMQLRELENRFEEQTRINQEKEAELDQKKEEFDKMIQEQKDYVQNEKDNYIGYLRGFVRKLEETENKKTEEIRKYINDHDITEEVHKRLVDHIVGNMWNRMKYYKDAERLVACFLSAIGSGQIILLTGAPGSGKSSFSEYIRKAIGAEVRRVVVQPNWTDSQDLLGYYNANDKSYVHTVFLDALIDAKKEEAEGKPFFVVLDEMNLAHVEYYFSMILSAMELDGRLSLLSETELREIKETNEEDWKLLSDLRIPGNVQFIGTLNADELSKNISPKVLDRSIIIELSSDDDPDRIREEIAPVAELEPWKLTWTILSQPKEQIYADEGNDAAKITEDVKRIYDEIELFFNEHRQRIYGAPLRFSPRCRKKVEYMAGRGATTEDIILGKLLPCINWEIREVDFDILKETIINVKDEEGRIILTDVAKERIGNKLDSMKIPSGGSVILDYWMSFGR